MIIAPLYKILGRPPSKIANAINELIFQLWVSEAFSVLAPFLIELISQPLISDVPKKEGGYPRNIPPRFQAATARDFHESKIHMKTFMCVPHFHWQRC